MKALLILYFTFFSLLLFGQLDTIYYTSSWTRTKLQKVIAFYGVKDYDENNAGMATYYFKTGELHSKQMEKDDLKHGLCIWYHKNGNLRCEGNYEMDQAEGVFNYYNEEGQLTHKNTYKNGEFISKTLFDPITGEELSIESAIIDFPDIEASYPGGTASLQKYIATNINYPSDAIEMNEQGIVIISFIVKSDGKIDNVEVVKGVSKSLDQEAIRIISQMQDWIPAEAKGEKVDTKCQLPIKFHLENGRSKKKRKD